MRYSGEFDVTILVTLRNPEEGLPSLYQEIYRNLSYRLQRDFSSFCHSEFASCFDYRELARQIRSAGFEDIRWLDFVRIGEARLNTEHIFGEHDLWKAKNLVLPRANVGARTRRGERRLVQATLRSIGRSPVVSGMIDGLGLRGGKFVRFGAAGQRKNPYDHEPQPQSTAPRRSRQGIGRRLQRVFARRSWSAVDVFPRPLTRDDDHRRHPGGERRAVDRPDEGARITARSAGVGVLSLYNGLQATGTT